MDKERQSMWTSIIVAALIVLIIVGIFAGLTILIPIAYRFVTSYALQVLWIGVIIAGLSIAIYIRNTFYAPITGGIVAGISVFILIVLIGYRYGITLWDWIKVLMVPAVLAGGGLWFGTQQREREQDIANRRAQDDALQAYLEGMSELLTDNERPLRKARPDDDLSALARARTLTVLGRLDSERKSSVLRFLFESGLIYKERIFLDASDLIERRHNVVSLQQANLRGLPLRNANLRGADLRDVVLGLADLRDADLRDADLRDADLSGESRSDLTTSTNLAEANLSGANLSGANLTWVNLKDTTLSGADLSGAILIGTDLSGADLSGANLSGAKYMTNEELEQHAKSLKGATMPNGQKYEEWLKSKGREEDKENSGAE